MHWLIALRCWCRSAPLVKVPEFLADPDLGTFATESLQRPCT
jgi:hypothetical protein